MVIVAISAPGKKGWEIGGDLLFTLCCATSSFCFLAFFARFARKRVAIFDSLRDNAYGMYLVHYAFALDWTGIWIWAGDREIRGTLDPVQRHADVFERNRGVQAPCKIEQSFSGAGGVQGLRHFPQCLC